MSFRLITIVFCLLLTSSTASAAPCARVRAQPDAWVARSIDSLVLSARAAYENENAEPAHDRVIKGINATLRQCKLAEDEVFVSRHREFVEFIQAVSVAQLPDHELGFLVPDRQYFEETRQYVEIPEFLLTPAFLRFVSRDESLPRAKAFLRDVNLKRAPADQLIFFSYRSQHLGTPDDDESFKRLLIVVPGNAAKGVPEKWVQFGITDRGSRVHIRNLSVVSAMPGPDGTNEIYFKDFFRTYRRDGSISIKGRWELGEGDDNCVKCHKSGILPIFPEPGTVSPGEQDALRAVNQRFLLYGAPRFQKYLDATKFGPGLSSASAGSRALRFGSSFGGTTVGQSMDCVACHQPERLGYLNWPMDETLISSFVQGGQMPKGHQLKTAERKELYKKLIQEYFAVDARNPGILKAWLMGKE